MKPFKLLLIGLLPLLAACESTDPLEVVNCSAQSIQFSSHNKANYIVETDYFNGHNFSWVVINYAERGKHKVGDSLVIGLKPDSGLDNIIGINRWYFIRWVE